MNLSVYIIFSLDFFVVCVSELLLRWARENNKSEVRERNREANEIKESN